MGCPFSQACVTFTVADRHHTFPSTKVYCLVLEVYVCVNNMCLSHCMKVKSSRELSQFMISGLRVWCPNHCTATPSHLTLTVIISYVLRSGKYLWWPWAAWQHGAAFWAKNCRQSSVETLRATCVSVSFNFTAFRVIFPDKNSELV